MMRLVLVGLLVCLIAAASSAAGEVRAVQDPVAGSYIVVFKSGRRQQRSGSERGA